MPRFNRQQRRTSRPNREWQGHTSSVFTTLAAGTQLLIGGFVPGAGDATILRTVGMLAVTSDQGASVEDQIGAFGIILVSDTAFAVGVTAIPDPITAQDDDGWFVYQAFCQQGDASVTSSLPRIYNFDSGAKRIVQSEGTSIAFTIVNVSGSHGLRFCLNFRMLAQLRGTG